LRSRYHQSVTLHSCRFCSFVRYGSILTFTNKLTNSNMKRKATAVWKGSGKEGSGHLSTQSSILNKTQYSFNSRFAEGTGTNPEELVAAAHSGCFTMKLSFVLGEAGFTPQELTTECTVTLEDGTVTQSQLVLKAKVPGISKEKFDACAEDAKANCPISKLLNTNISLTATLE
jgi:lipoyl-dependent peroxiredoxin